ncbi:type II and III secretion system protein family protein [Qipengyuania nanhaisediminis]|uniref:Pilus assembly protein CpaC n=1 Tax=Qipengyuania nanhaisediminis TaxID=604088 RepID=A0A1I5L6K3_9SPHN|nr:type II and III secretion system protein family protein [Qipengyuania nanhaisediminis]SFO92994.1 pilus assembly protein CpaC [Qipengyuania nanhaisediminis]
MAIKHSALSALAFATALGAATVPHAAIAQSGYASESMHAGTVEIPVNKSQVVTADVPIDRAMIGNDTIADILPVSDRSVYVLGKEIGTTSLTLYDRSNRVIAVMDIAVGPDVLSLREQMADLMPGETVDARMTGDAIVLSGTVSDAGVADRAVQLASAYAGEDKVVNLMTLGGSQQVMLEVRFAEVSRSIGKDLGVRTFFNGDRVSGVTGPGSQLTPGGGSSNFGNGDLQVSEVTNAFGVITRSFTDILGLDVDVALDALEEKGLAKTLAEPTLVALSGQQASFLAGGEFPVPVVQSGGVGGGQAGITVEFKSFGVGLGFTPTVLSNKVINLIVEPEVSSIDQSASITLNGIRIPGLQTRRASTVLELRDGESFAIAGLLQRDFQTTVNQVPLLGSIPLIGSLFRSTSFQKGETELLIIVTPRLVAPIRPEQVQLPTDRVKDPIQADVLLNGNAHRTNDLPPIAGDTPANTQQGTETNAQEAADGYEY